MAVRLRPWMGGQIFAPGNIRTSHIRVGRIRKEPEMALLRII